MWRKKRAIVVAGGVDPGWSLAPLHRRAAEVNAPGYNALGEEPVPQP